MIPKDVLSRAVRWHAPWYAGVTALFTPTVTLIIITKGQPGYPTSEKESENLSVQV